MNQLKVVELERHRDQLLISGQATDFLFDIERKKAVDLGGRVLGGAYSPDGAYFAFTQGADESGHLMLTQILDLAAGNVVARVTWEEKPAKGIGPAPIWLNGREVLIDSNVVGGSLVVSVQGDVINVPSALFGRGCSDRVCETIAAQLNVSNTFHILVDAEPDPGRTTWLLYHSEHREVEPLPLIELPVFSSDGRWLAGVLPAKAEGGYELWLRATDPLGATAQIFGPGLAYVPLSWSHDASKLAFALDNGVGALLVMPTTEVLSWSTGDYSPISVRWSSDNRHLAMQASGRVAEPAEALFVVTTP